MGMYDILGNNGEQVKCFEVNYPTADGEIACSAGSLNHYGVGEEVPYQSWSYNHGKDFLIIDCGYHDESLIHVIHNGKYDQTVTQAFWSTLIFNHCIDKLGNRLQNINDVADALTYVETFVDAQRQIFELFSRQSYVSAFSKYTQALRQQDCDDDTLEQLRQTYEAESALMNADVESCRHRLDRWNDVTSSDDVCLGRNLECIYRIICQHHIHQDALHFYVDHIQKELKRNPTCLDDYLAWSKSGPTTWQNDVVDVITTVKQMVRR